MKDLRALIDRVPYPDQITGIYDSIGSVAAVEAVLAPVRRLGVDPAIFFNDLSMAVARLIVEEPPGTSDADLVTRFNDLVMCRVLAFRRPDVA